MIIINITTIPAVTNISLTLVNYDYDCDYEIMRLRA